MSKKHIVAALLPPKWHGRLLRRWGHDIDPSARVGPFALVQVDHLTMAAGARISPLSRVRGARVEMGERAVISSLVSIIANTVKLGRDSAIGRFTTVAGDAGSDRCTFVLGDHSRVFPFCWIDPGFGVTCGDRVGIGGHSLIFTHASWSNYFKGATVTFGPIHIGDRVWLPWRVFLMPGVTIGEDAIVMAGSVVARTIPERSFAGGFPARVLRESAYEEVDDAEFASRIATVLTRFRTDEPALSSRLSIVQAGSAEPNPGDTVLGRALDDEAVRRWTAVGASVIDLTAERAWFVDGDEDSAAFARWLSSYGVRCDVMSGSAALVIARGDSDD